MDNKSGGIIGDAYIYDHNPFILNDSKYPVFSVSSQLPIEIEEDKFNFLLKINILGISENSLSLSVSDTDLYVKFIRPEPKNLKYTNVKYGEDVIIVSFGTVIERLDILSNVNNGYLHIIVSKKNYDRTSIPLDKPRRLDIKA